MSKSKKPLVAIVIVNWNGGKNIINCLKSLKKTKYNNYKTVVLDNGSTDDSIKRIKKFKEVILLKSGKNLGFARGSNFLYQYALKKFNPDYICNMNNDIVTIQREWLSLMVSSLEKRKDYGICSNKLLFPDGRLQLLYLERNPKDYLEKDNGQYDFIREVSAVGGANILIKRNVFEKIGGTDENYFYGPDDIDYCFRAREKGFKIIYNGFSKSIHIGSYSYLSAKKNFIYGYQSYGQLLFSYRHGKFLEKINMSLRQLIRTGILRKDPFSPISLSNLYFDGGFYKKIPIFLKSLIKATKNFNTVKNLYFNETKK